ncbi:MAG: DUF4055 domain-containing protein [Deltaproteobacteria bacterium]|nr:DUF4055 domain-containing protein [Deltaproteobacteria bacterium]
MPVEDIHPDYRERKEDWRTCRDGFAGDQAVKKAAKGGRHDYLPPLPGHDAAAKTSPWPPDPDSMPNSTSYVDYVGRAHYYEVSSATKRMLAGMVFRRDPSFVDAGTRLEALIGNINGAGQSLVEFSKRALDESLCVTRLGILADHTAGPADGEDEAPISERRPFLRLFVAEDIPNWASDGSLWVLDQQVRIGGDVFSAEVDDEKLVLGLDGSGYFQERFRKLGDHWIRFGGRVYPKWHDGSKIEKIPFYPVSSLGNSHKVDRPVLMDLVRENLHHFRLSAALENLITWLGGAALHVGGRTSKGSVIWGSSTAIETSESGSVNIVEMNGSGAAVIEKSMDRSERMMTAQGARLLEADKRGVEAADAIRERRSGSISTLGSLAGACSSAIESGLRDMARFLGEEAEPTFELNRDFDSRRLTPEMAKAISAIYQGRALGPRAYYRNLIDGEAIPAETTFEEFTEDLMSWVGPISADDVDSVTRLAGIGISPRRAGLARGLRQAEDWHDQELVGASYSTLKNVLHGDL